MRRLAILAALVLAALILPPAPTAYEEDSGADRSGTPACYAAEYGDTCRI